MMSFLRPVTGESREPVLVPAAKPQPAGEPMTPAARDANAGQVRSDLRSLGRGSSQNLAGSVVTAVLNIALPIIITRRYSSADAGTFFAATALFFILVNTGTVGSDTGILRFLPRARALGLQADMPRQLRTAFVTPVVISTVLGLALFIFAPQVARLASGPRSGQADVFQQFLHVLGPMLPVAVLYGIAMSATRGFGVLKPLVLVEKIGRGLLQTGLIVVVSVLHPTPLPLIVAWSTPYVVAGLVLTPWLRRLLRTALAGRPTDAAMLRSNRVLGREFWSFAAPRAVSRVFSVALQRFDIILVAAMLGAAEAAVYTVATRFLLLGQLFGQSIQEVMAPRISGLLAKEDRARSKLLYRTTTSWLTIVTWPLFLISAVFAPVLLGVFGGDYRRGSVVVVVLCLSMLVATTCGPVDTILLMAGRTSWSLYNTGAALAANVAVDLVLIPRLGINGAAFGWMVGILISNLVPLLQIRRSLGMHPFGRATLEVMVIAGLSIGLLPLAVRLVLGPTVIALILASVLGGAAYLLTLVCRRQVLELDALTSSLRLPGRRRRSGGVPTAG